MKHLRRAACCVLSATCLFVATTVVATTVEAGFSRPEAQVTITLVRWPFT